MLCITLVHKNSFIPQFVQETEQKEELAFVNCDILSLRATSNFCAVQYRIKVLLDIRVWPLAICIHVLPHHIFDIWTWLSALHLDKGIHTSFLWNTCIVCKTNYILDTCVLISSSNSERYTVPTFSHCNDLIYRSVNGRFCCS